MYSVLSLSLTDLPNPDDSIVAQSFLRETLEGIIGELEIILLLLLL